MHLIDFVLTFQSVRLAILGYVVRGGRVSELPRERVFGVHSGKANLRDESGPTQSHGTENDR